MGLREKVTITLVIIVLIQIACRHCMPRTPTKASLKRYLSDLKPVKNHPVPNSYGLNKAQKHTIGKTAQNGKISQKSLPKKSLYQTYKFPEMEFPLDNSPRDPFHIGMNFNDNNHVSTLQKARNLQNTAIKDLKKEMKMKRKLLSNKQMNNDNNPLKTDMSSGKIALNPVSMHVFDSESFPEVQYPLNTMETWGSNYRNYLPFTQGKHFSGFGQQTLNRQTKEDKPFTRLTKAKASKYLQSYDKLKDEQRRTSTQNSKRSNAGQKGLNFTKTATCEKTSDDFITASLVSNIANNSAEIKKTLKPSAKIKPSSENTCPVTNHPNHSVPIPYRSIENNTENECEFKQKKNTKELQDVDTSVIAQTLHLIEEILLHDDTSSAIPTGNHSKEIENHLDSSECTDVPANEDIPITFMDRAKNFTDCLAEEKFQVVLDDAAFGFLQDEMSLLPEEILADNCTAVESPLSDRMPLRFSELIEFEAGTNGSERGLNNTAPIASNNAVPGSKSIIIIPINNNSDGKSLSHVLETTSGTPIIVYLPSTEKSDIPTQNQIVSSLLENFVPNDDLSNVLSNMAPLQNANSPSIALVSESLNSISDSGSSLPMHETLPKNSMCYINESSPSAIKEKTIADIIIDKSFTDVAPLTSTICDENLSEQSTASDNFEMHSNTLPPTPDFEHLLFEFAGNEFSSLSHGPYNNVLSREINSEKQYSNVSSEDLFLPTQNVTSEDLHKNTSKDDSLEITIEADTSTTTLDQKCSFEEPTNSKPAPVIIDEMSGTPLIDSTVEQPLPIKTSLSLSPHSETISDHSSEIVDMNAPPTRSTITDNTSFLPDPVVDNSPITDMSIKSELYKIRQILDKMLSSQTPTNSQTTSSDAITLPISETDSLPKLVGDFFKPIQMLTESVALTDLDESILPLPATVSPVDSVRLQEHVKFLHIPIDGSSPDILPLPEDPSLIPSLLLDTTEKPSLIIDETVPPEPVFENSADNKPYFLDNQVTLLSETLTNDTLENGLSATIDDLPLKMDLVIPNIHELSNDEPLLHVVDLPIMVHQEHAKNLKFEVLNQQNQEFGSQKPLTDAPVNNLSNPDKLLPTPKVSEAVPPDDSSEFHTKTMSSYSYTDKMLQNFSPPFEDEKVEKVDFQLTNVPVLLLSDTFTNEPFLSDDSLSQIDAKTGKLVHSQTDTKDLPLVEYRLFSSDVFKTPDNFVTHVPTTVPLPTNSDKTTDTRLLKPILSNSPHHDILLTEDKMLPTTENTPTDLSLPINKIPSTSKLSIAMALLENVLYEISQEGLSSPVTKPFLVTPSLKLDKTEYQEEIVSLPLEGEEIFAKSETLPNPEKPEDILPLLDKEPSVTPYLNIPSKDSSFKMDGKPFIETVDMVTQKRTETLSLDGSDILLPIENVTLPNIRDRTSPSKTKAILENVVSDVPTRGLPVSSVNDNDETMYYLESPLSTINEEHPSTAGEIISSTTVPPKLFDEPNDCNLPHSRESEESFPFEVGKSLTAISRLDIPSEMPVSKILPFKPSSVLDKTLYYAESPLSDITDDSSSEKTLVNEILSSTIYSDQPTEDSPPFSEQFENTMSMAAEKSLSDVSNLDIPSEMPSLKDISNVDIALPKADSPTKNARSDVPLTNTKILSSSKLPIANALLKNVLSDVTSKSFPLPVSKDPPIISSSALDETLYYTESPLTDITDDSPIEEPSVKEIISSKTYSDQPSKDSPPFSEQFENTMPMEAEKSLSDVSNLDIHSEMPSLKDISNADIALPKADSSTKNARSDVPLTNTKILSSSKLPIAKALLQNVLSDVTSKSFPLPVSKGPPIISSSALDETLYNTESPLTNITDDSPLEESLVKEIISSTTYSDQPTEDNRPFSEQFENTMPMEAEKSLSDVSNLDIPSEMPSLKHISNVDIALPKADSPTKNARSDVPLTNTKILSSSKFPIANALLQNVLSDVTSKSFPLPVSKGPPIISSSALDETLYYTDSPLTDITADSPIEEPSVKEIISSTTYSDQSTKDSPPFSEQFENTMPMEAEKSLSDVSNLDTHSEMPSLKDISNADIALPKADSPTKNARSDVPVTNTKVLSSSKLPIAKALLQNVLSDVTSKSFSLPVSKGPPIISSSALDETLYYTESPLTNITDDSPLEESLVKEIISSTTYSDQPTEDNRPFCEQFENTMPMEAEKSLSDVSNLDIPSEMPSLKHISNVDIALPKADSPTKNARSDVPLTNTKILSSSKLPIANALLQNVLSDVTSKSFPLPVSKGPPIISSSALDETLYYTDSPLTDITDDSPIEEPSVKEIISSTTYSDQPTKDSPPFSEQFENTMPMEAEKSLSDVSNLDIPSEMPSLKDISNADIALPKADSPTKNVRSDVPLTNTKILSSSKFPIAKALLQNVLSDVTSKSFSLPVSKGHPIISSSALDKTLYYAESPLSDITNKSQSEKPSVNELISNTTYSDQPTEDNRPFSEQFENTMPMEAEKSLSDVSNLDIPSEIPSLKNISNVDIALPLPVPLTNTKILSSSKLPLAKALLQNDLSDVTSKGFSSAVLPVKSSSGFHKTLKYVKSPVSTNNEDNTSVGDEIISNTTRSDQSNNIDLTYSGIVNSKLDQDSLPLEADTTFPKDISNLDIPSEMSSLLDQTNEDMSPPQVEILPAETPNDLPLSNTKSISSSNSPITKALLENVLSDVFSKGFSLPVSKVLPVKSSFVLEKTHSTESTLSDLTEVVQSTSKVPSVNVNVSTTPFSDQPTNKILPSSNQSENTLSSEVDKTLSEFSSSDTIPELSSSLTDWLQPKSNVDFTLPNHEIIPKDSCEFLIPNNKSLTSSKSPIAKAHLENVLSDVTTKDFSLMVSKVPHAKSSSVLDSTLYLESPLSDLVEECPIQIANNNYTFSKLTSADVPLEMPTLMDSVLPKSNVDTTSPKTEVLLKGTPNELPSNNKTLSSSKLSITKTLLENVFSDLNTKGFSVPLAKSPPVESRTRLDKTLYWIMESSLSDSDEETSDDDFPYSANNDEVFNHRNLDTSAEYSRTDQSTKDESDDLNEEIEGEDSDKSSSDNPMDDTFDHPTQVEKPLFHSDSNMSNDLPKPQNKKLFASRVPTTKALLEKVLSDINDGRIRP